ncbi:hypothetical protein [Rhodococcus sp. BH5]|uniref:hypothetical protein n=1 Tax=Rhodococcus sp. BH5 TaxID=2871702 RepID=UPI0022CD5CEC|nr:hypothetical protein [Rhodococcus sp. BH5]MCZ9634862.1 hypothetical protein [Rhodococcus sp. BH5]
MTDEHADLVQLAESIGHSISVAGRVWSILRGSSDHQRPVFVSDNLDEARNYLAQRTAGVWWHLDMDDPTIRVEHPKGSGTTTTALIFDMNDPDAAPVLVHGGVGGEATSGSIFSVMVRDGQVPSIGHWYK